MTQINIYVPFGAPYSDEFVSPTETYRGGMRYDIPSGYADADAYPHLTLKLTAKTSDQILLAALGTSISVMTEP